MTEVTYVREDALTCRIVDEHAIVLNRSVNSLRLYNRVGTLLLKHLEQPATPDDLVNVVRGQFRTVEVSDAELATDVRQFVAMLEQQRIIRATTAIAATPVRPRIPEWRDDLQSIGSELVLPLWAKIEVSGRCHLNCVHCYLPHAERQPQKHPLPIRQPELTISEWRTALDELADLGCILLTVTGGEIFVRKDVFDVLDHAKQRGFVLELFTSGTTLTQRQLDGLRELDVAHVQISLYSADAAIHDRITGKSGSWGRSVQTTAALVSRGIEVTLACTLMNLNFEGMEDMRALGERTGARVEFGYPVTARTDRATDTHSLRPTDAQLNKLIADDPTFFEDPEPLGPDDRICPAGVNMVSIDASGNILPCGQFELPFGNVRNAPLGEIWRNSPVAQRLREIRYRDLKKPSTLGALDHYVGLCPGLNLLEEGDFLQPAAITVETTERIAVARRVASKAAASS